MLVEISRIDSVLCSCVACGDLVGEKDMLMSSSNYDAIYHAALVLHDLSGDPNLCYPAMRYCLANGVRGASDWLAESLCRHLSEKLSLSDSELRQMCLFALEHGYDDIAMTCFQRCSAGALDDMRRD